ncbi:MAG: succinate dehydrogenase cytochrome b subunit [Bdellovibrionota bacterium]
MSKTCCQIFHSSIFKKTIVALTGLIMIGFVFVHMLGNLQIFAGAGPSVDSTKINAYAALLKSQPLILWGSRLFLLLTVATHVLMTISLTQANRESRPQPYQMRKTYASAASRMMIFGGLTLLFYIVYHILHFTTGSVHSDLFSRHDVYSNVVLSFQNPVIVLVYVVAQIALFGHLYHGTVSVFQTLGFYRPSHIALIKAAGITLALVICAGFISIPVSVYFGLVS